MNHYTTSTGDRISQRAIDRRYSKSLKEKHNGNPIAICGGCGARAVHNDHTISQKRCKELHKTELIWNPDNYESSCAKCHQEWESYKDGKYMKHKNHIERMMFLLEHDKEGYITRVALTRTEVTIKS